MKGLKLSCPQAYYSDGMRIRCAQSKGYCGYQYFKRCKGWWALTEAAGRCKLRSLPDGGNHEKKPD